MREVTDLETTGNARGRRSRAHLLVAAARSFGEHGYARTRIADITEAAALSQGAFYRHFKDKNEILLAVLEGPLDTLLQTIDVLESGNVPPDVASLEAVHTAFFAAYAADRHLLRVLREAAAMHEPDLVDVWLGIRRRFLQQIEAWLDGLGANGPAEPEPGLLAEALGSLMDQLAYTRLGLATREPPRAEIEALGRVTARLWAGAMTQG